MTTNNIDIDARPRVWLDGETPETGVVVLRRNGEVRIWNDEDDEGIDGDFEGVEPLSNGNFGPLVEVIMPDYDAVVAQDAAARKTRNPQEPRDVH
jgi:hypothetical protein